jgi:hypothetical protein
MADALQEPYAELLLTTSAAAARLAHRTSEESVQRPRPA